MKNHKLAVYQQLLSHAQDEILTLTNDVDNSQDGQEQEYLNQSLNAWKETELELRTIIDHVL